MHAFPFLFFVEFLGVFGFYSFENGGKCMPERKEGFLFFNIKDVIGEIYPERLTMKGFN